MQTTILLLLAPAAVLTAGELVPAQIPATAKWVLHADLEGMRASETGKAVFAQIEKEHGAKLRALKRMFSFHPLNDLRDLTLCGDGKPEHAVMLLDGTFDRAHIEDVLRGADRHSEVPYAGLTIHTWDDQGTLQHAAFASSGLIAFSRQDNLLREELDVLTDKAPAASNPILPNPGSKPLITIGAQLADLPLPADSARILHTAETLTLSACETGGRFSIQLEAVTPDALQADRLRRILDGVVALAEAGNPELTSGGFRFDLNETAKPGVTAVVSLPVGEWLQLMKKASDQKK